MAQTPEALQGRLKGYIPTMPASRLLTRGLFAVALTGAFFYIQSTLGRAETSRYQEIIKRVNSNKTIQASQLYDITRLNQIEGARVQVQGNLQPGRFVVKRKRGDQDGYIVLAPFIVDSKDVNDWKGKRLNTKFMLNLGWVPKQSKHKIRQTAAIDILTFDELPQELANDEDAPATVTISAYVRRGEQSDTRRGYNNWVEDKLFKYIDLGLMQRLFVSNNASFRHIYLDRIIDEGNLDAFPFPNNAEQYTEQLQEEIAYNNSRRFSNITAVAATSCLAAVASLVGL